MRLVLTVLALILILLASTAEAISHRDYDGDSSHPLDFRIGAYHAGLGDSRSTRALTIDPSPRPIDWIMPMFDQSDRSHHGFFGWPSGRIDAPRARVPEPTTLLLLSAGIIVIGAWRLRRGLVLDRAGGPTENQARDFRKCSGFPGTMSVDHQQRACYRMLLRRRLAP